MRSVWKLPLEEEFQKPGKEWILHILSNVSTDTRSMIIFLPWRVWYHWNNFVHGDGKALITASASFISNYYLSFLAVTKPNLPGNYKTEGPSTWAAPS
jgi:hypothetical protein